MTTTKMTAAAIKAALRCPYGQSWDEAHNDLAADAAESARLAQLRQALRRDGRFREPIVWDVDDGVGTVLNGVHRVIAASAFPELEIDLQQGFAQVPEPIWTMHFELHDADPDDDEEGLLWSAIGSFPLDDDVWVQTDVAVGPNGDGMLYGSWYCPDDRVMEVPAAVIRQAETYGFHLEHIATTQDDDDA